MNKQQVFFWLKWKSIGHSLIIQNTLKFLIWTWDLRKSVSLNLSVSKILSPNLGIMKKLWHFFPKYVLHLLCFPLVHPYILYCSSVWLLLVRLPLVHLLPFSGPYEFFKILLFVCWVAYNPGSQSGRLLAKKNTTSFWTTNLKHIFVYF